MQRLNQVYTQRFNRRHRRVGHVLQGRYKAIVVDKDSYFKGIRTNRLQKLPGHLIFLAMRCSARPPPHAGVSLCSLSAVAGGERTDRQGGAACRNIGSTGITNSGRGGKHQAARADAEAVRLL
jgi:hypothetical protein